MKFENDNQVIKAIELTAKASNGHNIYSVSFKKAFVNYVLTQTENNSRTVMDVLNCTGINDPSYYQWKSYHKKGLFDASAAYSVSRVVKQSNDDIEQLLQKELQLITRKLELIRECKKLGLKVA